MNPVVEHIKLKDLACPLIRIDSARKQDRRLSFSLSLLVHISILFFVGLSLINPSRFSVDQGENSMEVSLVADPVEIQPEIAPELTAEFREEPIAKKPMVEKKEQVSVQSVGGAITESKPDYLRNPAPVYPDAARRRGQEGVVLLNVLVDRHGFPQKIEVRKSSGFKLLDDAAVKSVLKWTFQAATFGAMPVESNVDVPIRFELES